MELNPQRSRSRNVNMGNIQSNRSTHLQKPTFFFNSLFFSIQINSSDKKNHKDLSPDSRLTTMSEEEEVDQSRISTIQNSSQVY